MTEVEPATPADTGLQAERTSLSWTRTSLAVLANGLLLVFKRFPTEFDPARLVLAGFAAVVALTIFWVGTRRQRTLERRPLPQRVGAGHQVHLASALVLVLIVATALSLAG